MGAMQKSIQKRSEELVVQNLDSGTASFTQSPPRTKTNFSTSEEFILISAIIFYTDGMKLSVAQFPSG